MKRGMPWAGGLASWTEREIAYISVVFTWRLQEAKELAIQYHENGLEVKIGGPALTYKSMRKLMPPYAEIGGEVEALYHHNKHATMASRGCVKKCYFCIVPKSEGEITLLSDFTPKPFLCDNNVSALPVEYQEYIIDKYNKAKEVILDINSGFEPDSFDHDTFIRWKKLNKGPWRWGFDEIKEEEPARRMAMILKSVYKIRKRVYVLIGNEPFEECMYRINRVIEWGCEPFVQKMIPYNALEKKPIVKYDWDDQKLIDVARWANRWYWRKYKFEDYDRSKRGCQDFVGLQ